jgi:hypothetical protein
MVIADCGKGKTAVSYRWNVRRPVIGMGRRSSIAGRPGADHQRRVICHRNLKNSGEAVA